MASFPHVATAKMHDIAGTLQLKNICLCQCRYDVYSIEMPMMQYKITLDVLELQGIVVNNATGSRHVDWKLISTFHLSPSRTVSRSSDGRVKLKRPTLKVTCQYNLAKQ